MRYIYCGASSIKRWPRGPQSFHRNSDLSFPTQAIAASCWVVSRVNSLARFGILPLARGHIFVGINGTFFLGAKVEGDTIQGNRVICESQYYNGRIKALGIPVSSSNLLLSMFIFHFPSLYSFIPQMHAWWRPTSSAPTQSKPKKVRFAYKNLFYSPRHNVSSAPPTPPTPVPVAITPPSTGYGLPGPSPYVLSYVPHNPTTTVPPYAGHIYANPMLDSSSITYDLMEHPSTILTRNNYSLSVRTLREPATTPPLPFLAITCIHLPWTIKVYSSSAPYVTLEDVFISIYLNLRTNITGAEFNLFSKHDDQRRATRAYEKRYRRLRNTRAYEEEKRGGMKRVDFLMGHTQYLGLSNNPRYPEEWQLHVA